MLKIENGRAGALSIVFFAVALSVGFLAHAVPARADDVAERKARTEGAESRARMGDEAGTRGTEYDADNTGRNERDAGDTRLTADDQSLAGDNKQLAAIRREITANDSLSTYAKNVKIMIDDSNVVLRGPVSSEGEKRIIRDAVTKVAPALTIVDELEVASD